jgi:hypothetical protein
MNTRGRGSTHWTSHIRLVCTILIPVVIHGCYGSPLKAQAWTPARDEGTVSLTYQNYDVAGHYDALGRKNSNGGTQSQATVVEVDYGITDTFAVTVNLPFIASKYTGPPVYFVGGVETHPGPLDDGTYHGAFQDLRVEVRRLFWAGPIPVAPFVGASFPTHDYETVGEAVPGRHRRDLQVGANIGVNLDRVLAGAYVHGRYGYATAQRMEGFAFTRSNVDIEIGFPIASRFVLRGLAGWQIRHQGPSVQELTVDWEHHDRFIAPSYTNLGVGGSLPIGDVDVYALWLGTVRGSNGAHRARTIATGVTFAFGSRLRGLGSPSRTAPEVLGLSGNRVGRN